MSYPALSILCFEAECHVARNTNVCYLHAPADYVPYAPPCHSCTGTTTGTPAPTAAPTPTTTPAPTSKAAYSVEYKVNLAGSITVATFDSTQQGIAKSTVHHGHVRL